MIGILCAGDSEAAPFISMLNNCCVSEKAMLKFYKGRICGTEIVTLFSGVCKVNAAIAAQILIDQYKCDAIINAGTAGGIYEGLRQFDVVVSTEAAYYDVAEDILTEFHPWLDSVFFKSDPHMLSAARKAAQGKSDYRIFFGRVVTGERFIEAEERKNIYEKYSPLSADMETAAAAHVCFVNRIPFISVRAITDTADHDSLAEFEKNCEKASVVSADFVKKLLKEL